MVMSKQQFRLRRRDGSKSRRARRASSPTATLRVTWSADLLDRTARDVMTRNPKIVAPDQLAAEALALMNDKKITQLFVVDPKDESKKPAGILHIHDCLRAGLQ